MSIAPLSKLCEKPLLQSEELIDPEYLNGRRYLEFMVSLNQKYSCFRARKSFRLTWPLVAKALTKVHKNWLLFPEISPEGRFHYHACVEYDAKLDILYYDLKNYLHTTIGHTDRYMIDPGLHKAPKPQDVVPCRCLVCRLTYMSKQQKLMKTVLRFQCPIDDGAYLRMKAYVAEMKDKLISKANRRNICEALKYDI